MSNRDIFIQLADGYASVVWSGPSNRARAPIKRAELSKEDKSIQNDCVKFGVRMSS